MQKNYYAIIPANVRYDSELTPNAKLLYGEITALCNEKGYCWANNGYFSELYNVSKKSISKWISQLIDKKYVYSEIQYKEGSKEIVHRYLRIVPEPMEEKFNTPMEEKVKDNITLINTTSNTTKDIYIRYAEFVKLKESEYQKLIEQHGEYLTKKMIEVLDNYKGANGKKYKSDYRAILNWVAEKVQKETVKQVQATKKEMPRAYRSLQDWADEG